MNTGLEKSTSSSDSGVENSKMRPVLKQPVEAFLAQIEEMIAQRLGVGMGFGADRK